MKKFKIYPEWGKLYYEVYIYDTQKEMIEHALDFKAWYPKGSKKELRNSGGLTIPFTTYKQNKDGSQGGTLPFLGQMLFVKKHFNPLVVAHECLHALVFYSLRKGINIEKVFLGENSEGKFEKVLGAIPGSKRISKSIPKEILRYEHERFCMCHSYMMEQIIDKGGLKWEK